MALVLLTKFINQGKDFALGVEAGRIVERMMIGLPIEKQIIHGENFPQIQVFAQDLDQTLSSFDQLTEEGYWLEITCKQNKSGLSKFVASLANFLLKYLQWLNRKNAN